MLEWLLRKTFGLKKPPSRKDKARSKQTRDESAGENTDRENGAGVVTEEERVEPSLGDLATQSAGTIDVTMSEKSSQAPLTATRAPVPDEGGLDQAGRGQTDETKGKVHIFNFKAWFYADPVKAALTLGLAFLSWLATYTGMLELIQANAGTVDLWTRIAIGFAVMMLMLMILYLLDSLYSGGTPTWIKPVFVFGYLFLTLISVGFGFGFYWKYLEAQTEATRSAESAVSQVQVALQIGQTRLEQLQSTFTQLTALSVQKATQEREHGNSCPNSRPGEGPRMRLRDSDSQKFGYAAEYITGRANSVNTDLNALNGDLKKVVSRDKSTIGPDGTRNKFLRALGRKLDLTIARFNTLRTDPQLRQFRDNFDKRASTTVFPAGGGRKFRCPDVQLQTALRGVVRAIDDIPEIKNPKIAAVEGSEAIIEAFRRLAVTLAALPTLKLPPSPDELRKARKQALSAGRSVVEVSNIDAGLSKRDYIPLSAAVFVDLCILLISLNRSYDHLQRIQTSVSKARASEFGGTMLDIFEAHKSKISEEMLEIFHHAEFEQGRDYYLAVPLIKGSGKADLNERLHANQEKISQSKHEALDHDISVFEKKIMDLRKRRENAERLIGIRNSWQAAQQTLAGHQKHLLLVYKDDADEALATRLDVVDVRSKIQETQEFLLDFDEENGNLKNLKESVSLISKEIDDIEMGIGLLKRQRTEVHLQKQEFIEGQIASTTEQDLAKEARFLSNLCISLEANGVLHLASIYPFQRQVRSQLKKHNSRYYAESRNYRVYRFRKVADTQSQMILDLIMEAVKRSRKNGDIIDLDEQAKAELLKATEEQMRQEQEHKHELELQKIRQEEQLRLEKMENRFSEMNAKLANLTESPVKTEASPIDRGADDAVFDDSFMRAVNSGNRSSEVRRRGNKGISSILDAATGSGQTQDIFGSPQTASVVEPKESFSRETLAEKLVVAQSPTLVVPEPTPRKLVKMLGGLFSKASVAEEDKSLTAEAEQIHAEKELFSKQVDDTPTSETPAPETVKIPDTVEPVPEIIPTKSFANDDDDVRGHVNEDSLLPAKPDTQDLAVDRDEPVSAPEPEADLVSVEPEAVIISDMKASLKERVQNLDMMSNVTEGSLEPLGAEESDDHIKTDSFDMAAVSTENVTVKTVLTDPVILPPGDASQDPDDRFTVDMNVENSVPEDEPSEADQFEEGRIPGFLRGNDSLGEASDEAGARSWAKRLRPETDET